MKKTLMFSIAALAVLATGASAQFSTRWDKKPVYDLHHPGSSYSSFDWNRIDLAYTLDGKHDSYAGVYTPVARFDKLGVDFGPLLAKNVASSENPQGNDLNLGLFFTKDVYNKNGFTVRGGVGFKGIDLSNKASLSSGSGGTVFGVMLTLKS